MNIYETYRVSKGYREVRLYQSLSLPLSEGSFDSFLRVQRIFKPQRANLSKVTDSFAFSLQYLKVRWFYKLSPKTINVFFIFFEIDFKNIPHSCPLCNTVSDVLSEIHKANTKVHISLHIAQDLCLLSH